ncbi:MAG: NAD-dependent epimerase/dehydratase family protein [archaeon]
MKILLTGSTGMIGKAILAQLPKKHQVVEVSREKGIDITQKGAMANAMKGVNVVIHTAASLDEMAGKEEMQKVNVEGTQNVLDAAEKEGVKKFIHVSSVSVFGDRKQGVLKEESPQFPESTNEKTKAEAERRVSEMQEVFPVVIIRPALVVGPNKYWASIFKIVKKGFPLIGEGNNKWQMVDVDDVAGLIVKAVDEEKMEGNTYIAAERTGHTLREVVDMIADIQGVKRPGNIPRWAGMVISHVFGLKSMLTGKKSILIPGHVRRMFKHREYDISAALSTGWKPQYDTKQALEKTYRLLKEEGHI